MIIKEKDDSIENQIDVKHNEGKQKFIFEEISNMNSEEFIKCENKIISNDKYSDILHKTNIYKNIPSKVEKKSISSNIKFFYTISLLYRYINYDKIYIQTISPKF